MAIKAQATKDVFQQGNHIFKLDKAYHFEVDEDTHTVWDDMLNPQLFSEIEFNKHFEQVDVGEPTRLGYGAKDTFPRNGKR